ncbi:MAG: CHRD domain-containing protein [Cyanobium sp.]
MRNLLPSLLMAGAASGLSLLAAGDAHALVYRTTLGPEAAGATGSGTTSLLIDELTNSLRLKVDFSGLSGNTTVAHIHGPTAAPGTGTASVMVTTPSLPSFPVGYPNGTYDYTFDLLSPSTYRAGFITANGGTTAGARDAFLASLLDGKAYLNVHSTTYPSGEIRGFYAQVPAPSPLPLLGAGAALCWSRRLRRRHVAVR